jgi:hypothetical protein
MDNRQQRTIEMFQRTLRFIENNPITPEPALLAKMTRSLSTCIARLQTLHLQQSGTVGDMSARDVQLLRDHLRRGVMMPLVRIARPTLAFAPGVEQVLRVPHARADSATIATHALALAKAVTPHARLLASAGYSKEFLAEFTRDAGRLAAIATETDRARQRRARATLAIQREIEKGMQTVSVIEGIVMAHTTPDDRKGTMQLWRKMRRVHGRMGRPRTRGRTVRGDQPAPPPG